jgi:hypothetical protein
MNGLAWKRFFHTYFLVLRLICLHWSYGLLHLAWTALIIANFSTSAYQPADMAINMFNISIIPFISLLGLLLSALSASRAKRSRFDILENAYPTGIDTPLGNALAIVTATCAFMVVPVAFVFFRGPLGAFLWAFPAFLVETAVMITFLAAVVWLIQITIGIKRSVFAFLMLFWLGSMLAQALLNAERMPIALLMSFAIRTDGNYSELWGRMPLGNLPLLHNVFYAALILLATSLIVWQVGKRRFYQPVWPALLMAMVALATAIGAGRGYSLRILEPIRQSQQRANSGTSLEVPFGARTIEIDLDLADPTSPRFRAKLEVENRASVPLNQVTFTLNRQLTITDANLPYSREGDFIFFNLPESLMAGGILSIELTYKGPLWEYEMVQSVGAASIISRKVFADSFTHPDGIQLNCQAAWYPVPGEIRIGRLYSTHTIGETSYARNYPDCIFDQPAQFALNIKNSKGLQFTSNIPQAGENTFSASATTWAYLLGAPNVMSARIGNITLVTADSLMEFARPIIEDRYGPAFDHLAQFFPELKGVTVFALSRVLGNGFYETAATPITNGHVILTISPYYLEVLSKNPYNDYLFNGFAMIKSLFGVSDTRFIVISQGYVENISYFLWAHYMAKGDLDTLKRILTEGIPQGDGGLRAYFSQTMEERYPLATVLYDVYAKQGQAGLGKLLRTILAEAQQLNKLPNEQAIQWIKEASDAQ